MEFKRLGKDVEKIRKYLEQSEISFCDISVGAKYMWRDEYLIDYIIISDTLIMKEKGPDYEDFFYYPMGADVEGALKEIEKYFKERFKPLQFCCIDDAHAKALSERYYQAEVESEEDWNDYIYEAEKFRTYSGKKLSGQRNHVNKFKKLYPNYKVKLVQNSDLERIREFLTDYKSGLEGEKAEEAEIAFDLIANMEKLQQVGAYIEVDDKMVALSVGEVVGDTLIVHIEKALVCYDGVYPTMAQEFAKAFTDDNVTLINREEDCGDLGLRTSKRQYRPKEIKAKNSVIVKTLFDKILSPINIKTERLVIRDFEEKDKEAYAKLYLDDELNKLWGYDYREDLNGEKPTPDYFYRFQQSLKDKKEEYALAVEENGRLVGELVLHNFDYEGGVEMGFRFFRDCQGKGYATESASALKRFAFEKLNATRVKSRCYKENNPSHRLIERLGLKQVREDDTHYYFAIERE